MAGGSYPQDGDVVRSDGVTVVNMGDLLQSISDAVGGEAPSTTLLADTVTATSAAAALAANTAIKEVAVQADVANTTTLLVGNATKQPITLSAGMAIVIAAANLNEVYVKAGSGSPVANWIARA